MPKVNFWKVMGTLGSTDPQKKKKLRESNKVETKEMKAYNQSANEGVKLGYQAVK